MARLTSPTNRAGGGSNSGYASRRRIPSGDGSRNGCGPNRRSPSPRSMRGNAKPARRCWIFGSARRQLQEAERLAP
jgi:hypothetical protein